MKLKVMNSTFNILHIIAYFDNMEQAMTTLTFSSNFEYFARLFCSLQSSSEKHDYLGSEYSRFSASNFVDIFGRMVMALSVKGTKFEIIRKSRFSKSQ